MLAARYEPCVDSLTGKGAPVEQAHRHLQHLLCRFLRRSRAETPQGSLPACASSHVACQTGATRIRPITGRPSLFPTPIPAPLLVVLDRVMARPGTRYSALLAQASQHLWLASCYDVYREFTSVHHTIHPAPSPPDAGRYTVPSRFRCQSGDCGYRVRRLCTGRYLPAHLRRILLMEQQVWSIQLARQSTLRPRVAATN